MLKRIDLPEESFIQGWYMPDVTVCDDLIELFENKKEDQVPGHLFHEGKHQIIKEWKDSVDIAMHPDWPITSRYLEQLTAVLSEYKKMYIFCDETARWDVSAINLQKYNPGGGYSVFHSERLSGYSPMAQRHLVFMTYLNDVQEEGYTEFYYQKVAIRPRKGLTLIWPADWTHTHRGVPAPSETKYIATGWYNFTESGHFTESEEVAALWESKRNNA